MIRCRNYCAKLIQKLDISCWTSFFTSNGPRYRSSRQSCRAKTARGRGARRSDKLGINNRKVIAAYILGGTKPVDIRIRQRPWSFIINGKEYKECQGAG